MKVFKFGGSSIANVDRIINVKNIVTSNKEKKVVVLSAIGDSTDCLVEITEAFSKKSNKEIAPKIESLKKYYLQTISMLYNDDRSKKKAIQFVENTFDCIANILSEKYSEVRSKEILAQGELISVNLFHILLGEYNVKSAIFNSLDLITIDKDGTPDQEALRNNLLENIKNNRGLDIIVIPGYICRNEKGEVDNLQRGGSDYTASLIGAAVRAEEIQIWSDVDGFRNNDPRFVKDTQRIDYLSFDEAAELAYFGASILHPLAVLPAKVSNIAVRLKNTLNPKDKGTIITDHPDENNNTIKAVAAKDGITAIKIRSGRMLNAYGFLKSVFEIFEFFKTPIDMITTSEVAVSLTIDNDAHLEGIITELQEYGEVEVDKNQTIVCVVGDMTSNKGGQAKQIFDAIEDVPVRMISYGGSTHNISMLIATELKQEVLQMLSNRIFNS